MDAWMTNADDVTAVSSDGCRASGPRGLGPVSPSTSSPPETQPGGGASPGEPLPSARPGVL